MNILCVGDVSLDQYDSGESFIGGCSLNVARQLFEKLSHKKTGLYSPLGTDQNSIEVQNYLEKTEMEVRLKILEGDCPRQPIKIHEDGERELYNYHDGVLPQFTCEDMGGLFFKKWDLIAFPYYQQVEPMVESLLKLNLKSKLACDFGNLSDYGGNLEHVLPILDRLNYAQFSSESPNSERSKLFIENSKDKLLVDTHGPSGATAYADGQKLFMEAPQVLQVTDTTGAGDAFLAHILFAYYVKSHPLKKALEFALQGGAAQVGHLGPGPIMTH